MMQQYMMPPYMTMSMQQQAFSQPEQQQHAPETASLQMKMGNAFAQRPTSLPLAPTPSPLSPQQSNPHQYSYHPLAKQKEIETNLNNNISQNDIQHQQQQQKQSLRSDERRTSLVKDSPTHNRRTSMNMNKENNSDNNKNNTENIQQAVTVILSMEVCCARVSEEVTGMWGYYPQEFAHRSLYDFISPKDTDRLARLHRLLLDNIVDVAKSKEPPTQTERTTSELFHKMEQEQLTAIASGSSTFSDTLHVKKRSGEEELYEMLVCMGGGLGADLHQPASHSKLYIIAQFRKYRYEVSAQNPFESTANTMTNTASTTRFVSSSFSQTTSSSSPTHTDEQSPKHDAKNSPPDNNNNNKSNMKLGLKKNSLYLKSNPPFRHTMARTITDIGRGGPSMDMRSRSGLPAHYATSSQLNTISKFEPAKINVAPITQRSSTSLTSSWQTRLGKSSFSSSSSSSSSTSNTLYDQQQHHHNDNPDGSINNSHHLNNNSNTNNSSSSSHTHRHLHNSSPDNSDSISSSSSSSISTTTFTTPSTTTMAKPTFVSAPLSSARESNNPYASTLAAYRFAPVPSTKMTTGSPRGGPNVTHPTTQYFLQTSSSTLNAAASAAQYSSRHIYQSTPSSMADNDKASGKTDSSRKVEMSIRSLLC
ncbi:hypothetical protein BDA99DRAFT_529428 [Phascolomyces articulosus]|uniref:PAS domain-containing protein n=1 Tax=Phascolomyces articulosus TaxID=60185 RepID=A0AAD5P8K1_9FUNG|nr:hypothetical protein BDA99DRAFT_529428 [Phascolomyces articulosus]